MNLAKIRIMYDRSLPENKTFFDELKMVMDSCDYVTVFSRANKHIQTALRISSSIDCENFAINLLPGGYFFDEGEKLFFWASAEIPQRDENGHYDFLTEKMEMRESRDCILQIIECEDGEIVWDKNKKSANVLTVAGKPSSDVTSERVKGEEK